MVPQMCSEIRIVLFDVNILYPSVREIMPKNSEEHFIMWGLALNNFICVYRVNPN